MATKPTVSHTKWTREEDNRLLTQAGVFPNNLKKCFEIVSEETGRSYDAVKHRWYDHLAKAGSIKQSEKPSFWKRILRLFRIV